MYFSTFWHLRPVVPENILTHPMGVREISRDGGSE